MCVSVNEDSEIEMANNAIGEPVTCELAIRHAHSRKDRRGIRSCLHMKFHEPNQGIFEQYIYRSGGVEHRITCIQSCDKYASSTALLRFDSRTKSTSSVGYGFSWQASRIATNSKKK